MGSSSHTADVAIIGGGIAGLYTAWRLATESSLKVVVVEYTERFGGRYHTCIMPGGFPADMGAMRYLPPVHPILHKLIADMGLSIEQLNGDPKDSPRKNTVSKVEESADAKTITEARKKLVIPPGENWYQSVVHGTRQKAKDMSVGQWFTLHSNMSPVVNYEDRTYPSNITIADNMGFEKLFANKVSEDMMPLYGYHCIKGGMEQLIHALIDKIGSHVNVKLIRNCAIYRIEEREADFSVKSNSVEIRANKLILACNARGIELITWIGPYNRATSLQILLKNVAKAHGFKLFLTFRTAWWEEFGLYSGSITTLAPAFHVIAFGSRGKSDKYATLLAAFSYVQQDIFEGLNMPDAKRFDNEVGTIPADLVPSKRLVDYILQRLADRFGVGHEQIPHPVCAAAKIWSSDPIDAGNFQSRVGVDGYELQWKAMKPFDDLPLFITGDTFNAMSEKGAYIGWSEGPLLNSERILVNHFGLVPYHHDIAIHEEMLKSKL